MTEKSTKKDVVNWKEKLAAEAQEVAKAERPTNSFISLRGGAISYNDQVVPKLDVVIVAATYERTYYDTPFDSDNLSAPACFAQHTEESMLMPHEDVPKPIHTECHTCPLSQWGSATTGSGKGQECKIRRKLALLPYGSEDYAEAELAILAIPPTSGRWFSAYANKLATGAGLPPWAAGTEITTEMDPKTQFKVNFKALEPLAEKHLAPVNGRIEGAEAILLTPYDLSTDDKEAPAESDKY